jgi:hypothetical protein
MQNVSLFATVDIDISLLGNRDDAGISEPAAKA